ncbi:uncharacterized protein LOC127101896 [Lathyrus oleraceus]|uniref:uncharacterized protein LOC127101896 n=1 Tax=Pisum sativum TaxID=3888 RepID=UPI0021D0B5B9|nr:uncharacterized protein LOC127101896 [Pisum sativum]
MVAWVQIEGKEKIKTLNNTSSILFSKLSYSLPNTLHFLHLPKTSIQPLVIFFFSTTVISLIKYVDIQNVMDASASLDHSCLPSHVIGTEMIYTARGRQHLFDIDQEEDNICVIGT